ncbi:MAG TPA: hypothetical protein VGF16_13800 [Bryobacteraceae bacterium]|jgi:hypothetical protein
MMGASQGHAPLDDPTVAYILETRRAFEDLRQLAAQLAGLLVLEAAGAKSGGPEHPMLAAAGQRHAEALEAIHGARATMRARRHHEFLLAAADAIGGAIEAANRGIEIDPILTPLRTAYGHLQGASRELPGFEMVSFEQGCCAVPMRSNR